MIKELFNIGPIVISPFGAMMVLAFLAAYVQLRWGLKQQGIGDDEDASAILLAGGIGGIAGAKVYYAILYGDWRLLLDRAGFVWYGGFVVGLLAVVWVIRRRNLPFWQTTDAIAPALALGYGIGRIGCFLVGDDFGMPTEKPWGIAFPYGLPGPTTAGLLRNEYGADIPWDIPDGQLVTVHPTQLYETLAALAIWFIGVWLLKRGGRQGTATVVVIAFLAIERFLVEFLRAKDDRFFGTLTMAQAISVGVLVIVLFVVAMRRRASDEKSVAGST
jgi:phosphatidylglycerol:prolipoprotein diacylglycerol transferase